MNLLLMGVKRNAHVTYNQYSKLHIEYMTHPSVAYTQNVMSVVDNQVADQLAIQTHFCLFSFLKLSTLLRVRRTTSCISPKSSLSSPPNEEL